MFQPAASISYRRKKKIQIWLQLQENFKMMTPTTFLNHLSSRNPINQKFDMLRITPLRYLRGSFLLLALLQRYVLLKTTCWNNSCNFHFTFSKESEKNVEESPIQNASKALDQFMKFDKKYSHFKSQKKPDSPEDTDDSEPITG